MTISILHGDCRETLKTLPECSVHMAVTSPPYWALRSYLPAGHELKALELGSETTPDEFVANLVGVFREVRRVLRDDGTLWVNLGDTYAASGRGGGGGSFQDGDVGTKIDASNSRRKPVDGYQPLDRLLIPAHFALAMQADGWLLRDEIIWHKPSPMPSSVDGIRWERCRVKVNGRSVTNDKRGGFRQGTRNVERDGAAHRVAEWSDCPGCPKCRDNDGWVLRRGSWRTTAAHEMIYLFAKTRDYYCDAEAVRTPSGENGTANPRSVWTIGPEPLRRKHYAAYPSEIPRRCILAGTSAKGVCSKCGAPWARMVEKPKVGTWHKHTNDEAGGQCGQEKTYDRGSWPEAKTIGWRSTCDCNAGDPVPATVLDPFGGSGTTAIAAKLLGRNAILCELNPEYIEIQQARFNETAPLLMGCGGESQ